MSAKNPWKIKSKKIVYENQWVRLDVSDVVNPNGGDGIYSVLHFKNYAIAILAIDDNYDTWIVGQYRFPLEKYSWEIPEGGGDLNISPLESAKRELLEEAGLKAETWIKIQEFSLSNSATDEWGIIYVAKNISIHESNPEETEQLELKKISFNILYEKVMNGEIHDGLTIMAVLKTKILIDEGKL